MLTFVTPAPLQGGTNTDRTRTHAAKHRERAASLFSSSTNRRVLNQYTDKKKFSTLIKNKILLYLNRYLSLHALVSNVMFKIHCVAMLFFTDKVFIASRSRSINQSEHKNTNKHGSAISQRHDVT